MTKRSKKKSWLTEGMLLSIHPNVRENANKAKQQEWPTIVKMSRLKERIDLYTGNEVKPIFI